MSFLDDPIAKKHAGYFFLLLCSWIACCVIFGGELHRAEIEDVNESTTPTTTRREVRDGAYGMHYNKYTTDVTTTVTITPNNGATTTTVTSTTGDVSYDQCSSFSLCDKCYSAGAGAVAMAVFAFLGLTFAVVLRALVLAQKHSHVPKLGDSDATYALVERVTNYTAAGLYFIAIIAWGGGCIAATASTTGVSKVVPTGYVYVVLCLIALGGGIYLIHKIHEKKQDSVAPAAAESPPRRSPHRLLHRL